MPETFDILKSVKDALGITGEFMDPTLNAYIKEVQNYLKSAGVKESIVTSEAASGIISSGVSDLWSYGAGNGKLSPYFYERAIQLKLEGGE